MTDEDLVTLLQEGRRRERAQTLFYRSLTGRAEEIGDAAAAERLNALLADEQHHLSRLTARLLELGERPAGFEPADPSEPALEGWEASARQREEDEVAWYQAAVERIQDPPTRAAFMEILASELHHRDELGGKWMPAAKQPREPGAPS